MACFGCLSGAARRKEEDPLIIDVEQTIADAAWDMFVHSYGRSVFFPSLISRTVSVDVTHHVYLLSVFVCRWG